MKSEGILATKFIEIDRQQKRTGGRHVRITTVKPDPAPILAPAPTPAQCMEDIEEYPEMVYFFAEKEDGRIMAIDSKGNMMTPQASPALAADAPPPLPPIVPLPAPATARGGPNDSGDDNDGEDEDDEDYERAEQSINGQDVSVNNNDNSYGN